MSATRGRKLWRLILNLMHALVLDLAGLSQLSNSGFPLQALLQAITLYPGLFLFPHSMLWSTSIVSLCASPLRGNQFVAYCRGWDA